MLDSEMIFSRYIFTVGPRHLFSMNQALTSAHPGTFLKNITDNAAFTYTARYENYSEPAHGTLDFCDTAIDSIDQPGGPRRHDCPPQKGFALIMMSYWVQPMYIVPVIVRNHRCQCVCFQGLRVVMLSSNKGAFLFQIRYGDTRGRADLLLRNEHVL